MHAAHHKNQCIHRIYMYLILISLRLCWGRLRLDIRKNLITERVEQAVQGRGELRYLEVFRNHVYMALRHRILWWA